MKPAPFTRLTGHAAALREENIDTDIIFPGRFLLITQREGLGAYAFHDRRLAPDGSEIEGYVLNKSPFRDAPIIIAGANFGSGSSREHAVWTMMGRGIRAVIAPSLGEIFHSNCLRNGMLPIILSVDVISILFDAAEAERKFTIDLEAQQLSVEGMAPLAFSLPPERRLAMLNGWDETDQIINQYGAQIDSFEAGQRQVQPWLYEKVAEVRKHV